MSKWQRIFGRPKPSETPISPDRDFPLPDLSGLDDKEIDSAVEDALSTPVESFDEEKSTQDSVIEVVDSAAPKVEMDAIVANESASIENVEDQTRNMEETLKAEVVPPNIPQNKAMPTPSTIGRSAAQRVQSPGNEVDAMREVKEDVEKEQEEDLLNPSPDSHDHLEDLEQVDGLILPELQVPDWRQELEFAQERYEPCDLANHLVKVSKRRFVARRIDVELALSRRNANKRFLDRATRRFKEKIDEDAVLNDALKDLSQWKSQQSFSVAWKLAERVDQELKKAKSTESEAIAFIQNNTEFNNSEAIEQYRYFVRRFFLIPLVTLYLMSVVGLTYNRFEWILKFIPPFNLGLLRTLILISGVSAGFWLANLWKYAKRVSKVNKQAVAFEKLYKEQEKKIAHAVAEHTRLSQQAPMIEPILQVLSKAYRVQLQSDTSVKAHATTFFDPASLPACVTLARAEDNDEIKMAKLKRRALSVLMKPGWRTEGLDRIARIHADSRMLDSNSLSLKSLDTDSLVSASNAQRVLLEAFSNRDIHGRVSKERLREAIENLHEEVLAKWESSDRPTVVSLRDDGFNRVSFRSSWLQEQDVSEDWIEFLSEILSAETSPFGVFNIQDKTSELNKRELISSVAVVPHYFEINNPKIKIQHSPVTDVLPMDVVVRVDVSAWANPSAFAVFAQANEPAVSKDSVAIEDVLDGDTSA